MTDNGQSNQPGEHIKPGSRIGLILKRGLDRTVRFLDKINGLLLTLFTLALVVVGILQWRTLDKTDETLKLQQRAWIGPANARLANTLAEGRDIHILIDVKNFGKEPAIDFAYRNSALKGDLRDSFVEPPGETARQTNPAFKKKCMEISTKEPGQVIYPDGVANPLEEKIVKSDGLGEHMANLISGKEVLFLHGCFVYETVHQVRHAFYCYSYQAGVSKGLDMDVCRIGHDAD
jgi:hypothetical protein